MLNVKEIYENIKTERIESHSGKTKDICIDIKTYESLVAACKEWEKIQKEIGVRWVQVSREKANKKMAKKCLNKK
jgi:hypothetical protein